MVVLTVKVVDDGGLSVGDVVEMVLVEVDVE